MSRIGNAPIELPKGVEVKVDRGVVRVKGPKGEMTYATRPEITVKVDDGQIVVSRSSEVKQHRAYHGLTRALVANMVQGVSEGYRKALQIVGVGYRADMRGQDLVLNVGYSHEVVYPQPDGITLTTPTQTQIVVEGIDKQKVGQVAAELRAVRPPEPYKGKGIRYEGEHVRRKAGKTGA
jgi:large subunit ribosomal protein L6